MKLIKAEVEWYEGFANKPRLVLIVDKMPDSMEIEYEVKDNLYWGEKNGIVSFFSHSPENQRGYGGREFDLKMKDGSFVTIKGPWSSRAGAMNNYFPHSVDVTVKETEGEFPRLSFATAVTVELARQAAELAGVRLIKESWHDDIVYEVHKS